MAQGNPAPRWTCSCGNQNPDRNQFCGQCGSARPQQAPPTLAAPTAPTAGGGQPVIQMTPQELEDALRRAAAEGARQAQQSQGGQGQGGNNAPAGGQTPDPHADPHGQQQGGGFLERFKPKPKGQGSSPFDLFGPKGGGDKGGGH